MPQKVFSIQRKAREKVISPHFSFFHLDTSIYRLLLKATDDSEEFIKLPTVCLQLRKLFKQLRQMWQRAAWVFLPFSFFFFPGTAGLYKLFSTCAPALFPPLICMQETQPRKPGVFKVSLQGNGVSLRFYIWSDWSCWFKLFGKSSSYSYSQLHSDPY